MKKYLELLAVIIVSLIIFYIVINWTLSVIIHNRKEVMVPNIEGKSLEYAIDILSLSGLGLIKEAEEFNAQLPSATVIRQNPSPGMTVREGKTIKVVLSKGSDLLFVPDVTGKTLKAAELEIRRSKLQIGKKEQVYSLIFDKNIIISQNPKPESIVEKDSIIDLTVSFGKPPEGIVLMPDFIGKNLIEVDRWAQENKINFEVEEKIQKSATEEIVLDQEPLPDTVLTYDTKIKITVPKSSYLVSETHTEKKLLNVFNYEVPQGSRETKVRIVLIDSKGEYEIFSGIKTPGSKISVPYQKEGKAKIRVFSNNILIEERELQ